MGAAATAQCTSGVRAAVTASSVYAKCVAVARQRVSGVCVAAAAPDVRAERVATRKQCTNAARTSEAWQHMCRRWGGCRTDGSVRGRSEGGRSVRAVYVLTSGRAVYEDVAAQCTGRGCAVYASMCAQCTRAAQSSSSVEQEGEGVNRCRVCERVAQSTRRVTHVVHHHRCRVWKRRKSEGRLERYTGAATQE